MLLKWLLWFFGIFIITESRKLWEFDQFTTLERMMKMVLESCRNNDRLSHLTLIFGDLNEAIDESLIIRMNNFGNFENDREHDHGVSNSGTSRIVFVVNTVDQLQSNLTLFKKTRWWNHMAFYLIVGKNDKSCMDFKDMLNTTWAMDIINSIYICTTLENKTVLYTLNPITNYAPYSWESVETSTGINYFRQNVDANISCKNLSYDKTKIFNGYSIRVMNFFINRGKIIVPINFFKENSSNIRVKIFDSLRKSLNLTIIFRGPTGVDFVHGIHDNFSDMSAQPSPVYFHIGKPFLFPHKMTKTIAVVKSREASTLQKIIHLWSTEVQILAFIALIILLVVLAIKNNDHSSALLDLTRYLTFVSIHTNDRNNAFRIYFATMLIFIVISNGVFQGKIASFLTKPDKVKVLTIKQLIDSGYTFYTGGHHWSAFEDRYSTDPAIMVTDNDCIARVLNTTLAACLLNLERYQRNYIDLPLDHVAEPLDIIPNTFFCRHNWPLHNRINYFIMKLFESGLVDHWDQMSTYVPTHKREEQEFELNLAKYRPIKLVKLDFAVKLLASGLLLSAITFLVELLIVKYRSHVRRN